MMYRLCAAIFVLALAAPATGSPAGPEGGTAVLEVDSLAGVTGFFNLGQGAVRIVALVSPTSPECVAGLDSIGALLSRFPSRRLRTYVVFMPMLDSDTRISALVRVGEFTDRRVVFFWNQNRSVGDAFGPLISFDGPAWNAYFLYDTDATIGFHHPGEPDLLMQPGGNNGASLDSDALSQRVGELLDAFEEKRREAQKQTE